MSLMVISAAGAGVWVGIAVAGSGSEVDVAGMVVGVEMAGWGVSVIRAVGGGGASTGAKHALSVRVNKIRRVCFMVVSSKENWR